MQLKCTPNYTLHNTHITAYRKYSIKSKFLRNIFISVYIVRISWKKQKYIEVEKGSGVDDLQISDSFIQLQLCSKLWQTNIRLSFFLKRLSPGSNNDPNVGKFINNQTGFVLICSRSVFKYFPNSS